MLFFTDVKQPLYFFKWVRNEKQYGNVLGIITLKNNDDTKISKGIVLG